eukprot:COSAG03_NODE_29454_length_183_cov_223.559524_1_plen_48_part_01
MISRQEHAEQGRHGRGGGSTATMLVLQQLFSSSMGVVSPLSLYCKSET